MHECVGQHGPANRSPDRDARIAVRDGPHACFISALFAPAAGAMDDKLDRDIRWQRANGPHQNIDALQPSRPAS